jgi:hypothetical protein
MATLVVGVISSKAVELMAGTPEEVTTTERGWKNFMGGWTGAPAVCPNIPSI